jgi:hypothetical protein
MAAYLVSYRPLAISARGRKIAEKYNFAPFIDSSCRREPDLNHSFPSISALCRAGKFAPKLRVGDEILYITVQSKFGVRSGLSYRATAHLEVIEVFSNHLDASKWYLSRNLEIPSNCMIPENPPHPLYATVYKFARKEKQLSDEKRLFDWNKGYLRRSKKHGTFVVCKPIWIDLVNPGVLTKSAFVEVFGRMPGTQNPPTVKSEEISKLLAMAGT